MCGSHTCPSSHGSPPKRVGSAHWPPPWAGDTLPRMTEPFSAPSSREDVERHISDNDVEFLFAQFVDMHGKPSAKLVPATHLDGLLSGRRGLRGIRRRRHRPAAQRPRHGGDAGRPLAHPVAVEAERRAHRLRRARRGRGVAVLPAHDPAPPARPRARARLRVHARRRARVLPRAHARRRLDRARRPARHARPALLRHARAHAQPRLHVGGLALRDAARLEQLRERPRGRERPVRAELRVRRRAHHLRPRDLLPLHGRVARPGARADRDLHAEAVRPPHRQRLPLPHEPLEGRRERLRVRSLGRPARARADRDGVQLHRRAEGAREGLHRAHRADHQLLQAARRRHAQRLELGPGLRELRLQQPHADAAHPRRRTGRGPHGRRLMQPLPGRPRRSSPPASTGSSAGSTPATRPPSSTCTS